jgi:hypothetical protein
MRVRFSFAFLAASRDTCFTRSREDAKSPAATVKEDWDQQTKSIKGLFIDLRSITA